MAKARNIVISGARAGDRIRYDYSAKKISVGLFPMNRETIRKYSIISNKDGVNAVSAVGRAAFGSALFGIGGAAAGLSAKHDSIYRIHIDWNYYGKQKDSVIEIDEKFYEAFMHGMNYLKPDELSEFAKTDEELLQEHLRREAEKRGEQQPPTHPVKEDKPLETPTSNGVSPTTSSDEAINAIRKLSELHKIAVLSDHEYALKVDEVIAKL